jgi:hypothetical protein
LIALDKEGIFFPLHILEIYSTILRGDLLLQTELLCVLEIRNNCSSWSLGAPSHSAWRESSERWLWRGRSDVDLLRCVSIGGLDSEGRSS